LGVLVLSTVSGCGGDPSDDGSVVLKPKSSKTETKSETKTEQADEPTTSAGIGSVHGVIKFDGPRPQLPPHVKKGAPIKEPYCAATTVPDESLVVSAEGGIANVFIFLAKPPKQATVPPIPEEPAVFDQEQCRFVPHALLVRTGQIIKIKSNDDVLHNTNIEPVRNDRFNQTIKVKYREGIDYVYEKPEPKPILVKCDIHPWMSAWHLPLDHPYAAVTAEDGSFTIEDLPAGEHEFRVWHEKVDGFLDRRYKVTIKPDETIEVLISYKAEKFKI